MVDNASEGGAVTALCERHPFATALTLDRNAGFSAAVNAGAARASGDVLVSLNDDCRCDPGFVEALVAALDPPAGVAMAAGVLRHAARPDLIDTAGLVIDRTLLAYDHLSGEPLSALAAAPDPFGPSGAAAAYDRDAFAALGGFDEGLFAYWEDTDLALRMVREGYRCRLATDALGTHEHSATLGAGSAEKNRLTGFGRGYVLRKWGVVTPRRAASGALPRARRARGSGPDRSRPLGRARPDRRLAGGARAGAIPSWTPRRSPETGSSAALARRWRRRRG